MKKRDCLRIVAVLGVVLIAACGNETDALTLEPVTEEGETTQQSLVIRGLLRAPAGLARGDSLVSPDGNFRLIHQGDGNVVLYNSLNIPLWATNTGGRATTRLIMQGDGNLVLFNGVQVVRSNTIPTNTSGPGRTNVRLAMQDDGNLVLYSNAGVLWQTRTSRSQNGELCGVIGACNNRNSEVDPYRWCFSNTNDPASVRKVFRDGAGNFTFTLELEGAGNCRSYVRATAAPWFDRGTRNITVWIESNGVRYGQRTRNADIRNDAVSGMFYLPGRQVRACAVVAGLGQGCTSFGVARN